MGLRSMIRHKCTKLLLWLLASSLRDTVLGATADLTRTVCAWHPPYLFTSGIPRQHP